jgi:hypothetical protein
MKQPVLPIANFLNVILNLFQDLFQSRFRTKFGMTEEVRSDREGLHFSAYSLLLTPCFFFLSSRTPPALSKVEVIRGRFQNRFQVHIGLIDSGSAVGMTKRGSKECHPELVSGSYRPNGFRLGGRNDKAGLHFSRLLLTSCCLLPILCSLSPVSRLLTQNRQLLHILPSMNARLTPNSVYSRCVTGIMWSRPIC